MGYKGRGGSRGGGPGGQDPNMKKKIKLLKEGENVAYGRYFSC